jgi:hypothetical protein
MMESSNPKLDTKIYRIHGSVCTMQHDLDGGEHPVMHDYLLVKGKDRFLMLKCRSCGYVNHQWKQIFS